MKKNLIFALLLLAISNGLAAQENPLSLQQCIEIGLERNYTLRIVRNQQQISENNATIGNAGYLPTADLGAGVNGTHYDYNNRLSDKSTERIKGVNNETADIGIDVNWTVFDGLGIQATYAKLQELQRMGELNTRLSLEDFVAQLSAEYFNLVCQNIRLKNMRSTLKLSRERLRIVEARYTIGNSSRLELQQAKVDFNADSSNVLSQHQVVHASRIRLNELMALPDVDALTVVQDSSIISNLALDENTMWTNTLANNTSLRIMQKEVRLSELDYKKIKSRNYPTVRLTAGYGYIANWYGNSTTDLQRRWGANYGMNVAIPIFDGLNRRREQRNARLEIENTTLRTEELLLQLKADMSNLWMSYKNNLSLCALEYENTTIARDNYGIAIDRYKLGDLSGIELREAQNSLFQAEERLAAAEYATKVCEISLLQLSGQIIR